MITNKVIIYLAELAHDGFGLSLNTIPLGIGNVGAYTKKIFGDQVELRLFRRVGDLIDAVLETTPHIVGFGYYSWNDNLTLAAVSKIKKMSSDILIVVGGANISTSGWEQSWEDSQAISEPERDKLCSFHARRYDNSLLKNNTSINYIVHGDGEIPFANLVQRYIDGFDQRTNPNDPIDGCSSLIDGKLMAGAPVELLNDLDRIPSPYIMGLFDQFLEEYKLIPQIETVRGCPYECTYCSIGGNINKLRKHSFDHTKKEILYIKDHASNKILRVADSNWGILKSDIKLAEFINELHDRQGYPTSLRVYYAERGPYDNIRIMADSLKKFLPLNMSFQTLSTHVLKEIKRTNMPYLKVREMVAFAHDNDISVSTELIYGLPCETYDSFRNVFDDVVKLNFDSVYVGSLYLIKGSELYTDAAREKYGFKTMYNLIGKDVTFLNSQCIFEADEVVVQSNSMPQDDFWKLQKLSLFIFLCYGAAFLKEIIRHCMNYAVSVLQIYDELTGNFSKYPFFNLMLTEYLDKLKSRYFDTIEDLRKDIIRNVNESGSIDNFSRVRLFVYYAGKMLSSEGKTKFIAEFINAADSIYRQLLTGDENEDFFIQLNLLGDLASEIIISPLEELEEEVVYKCDYDLVAWAKDGYCNPLSDYHCNGSKKFSLWVRNIHEHRAMTERMINCNDMDKYQNYFSTVVSSNLRRHIKYSNN